MAERVLKVKTVSDVAEAISGLTDLSGSLRNVGTAAIEAAGKSKGEWKALEAEWQKSSPTLKGVADAAFKVESALNAMGRAGTASKLESELVKSQVALNQYKAKLEEVREAGGAIDEGMRHSLSVMQSGIEAGRAKLEELRGSTERAKEQLGLVGKSGEEAGKSLRNFGDNAGKIPPKLTDTAKGASNAAQEIERLASSTGSTTGLLKGLALMGGEAGGALGVLAAKLFSAGAALKAGWEIGRKFDDVLKQIGVDLSDPVTGLEKLEAALQKTPAAAKDASASLTDVVSGTAALNRGLAGIPEPLKKVVLGVIELGKEASGARPKVAGLAVDISLEKGELTEHTRALLANIVARRAAKDATTEVDAAVRASIPGWVSAAEKQKEVASDAAILAAKFADLQKNGADWRLEVEANEAPLARFAEGLAESKTKLSDLPQPLQDAIAYLEELRKKHEAGAAAAKAHGAAETEAARRARENAEGANRTGAPVTQKVDNGEREGAKVIQDTAEAILEKAAAYEGSRRAAEEAAAADRAAAEANDVARAAAEQATRVQQQMNEATHAGITEMNGWVGVQGSASIINLQVAAAEEAQIERLRELLRLTRAVKEEQLAVFDTAQGWTDYIAVMVDSFDQGFTSLQQLITGLSGFKTGLLQLYGQGGAGSAANEGLRDMLQSIQALINAAVGGQLKRGPTDPTPRGALERAFSGKRKK